MKIAFIIILFISISCSKERISSDIPGCIKKEIRKMKRNINHTNAMVEELTSKEGVRFYAIAAPCCDQLNPLYDDNCNLLCYISGGLTGKGDGKCPDYDWENFKKRVIWQKK